MTASDHLSSQFDGMDTSLLMNHAHRATPAHERDDWMLTSEHDAEDFHNLHPDDQRSMVIDQLSHYGVDRAEINRRRS